MSRIRPMHSSFFYRMNQIFISMKRLLKKCTGKNAVPCRLFPVDYESFRHPEDIEVAILILSESFFKERFPPSNLALCSIQHSLNGTNELAIPMLPDKITIAKIFGITNGMILWRDNDLDRADALCPVISQSLAQVISYGLSPARFRHFPSLWK